MGDGLEEGICRLPIKTRHEGVHEDKHGDAYSDTHGGDEGEFLVADEVGVGYLRVDRIKFFGHESRFYRYYYVAFMYALQHFYIIGRDDARNYSGHGIVVF